MSTRRLEVQFVGDTASLDRAFSRVNGQAGQFESRSSRIAGRLRSLAKVGVLAGVGIGAVFTKTGIENAIAEEKALARVENVVKTTGGVANVTTKDVENLSVALQKQTGTADDLIQTSAGLLLTFTKVRNEQGKNNDIFDQGVAIANDLAVGLGTDLNSATIQVGKALNDPIRGVTSLRRAGVQLTEQQEKQIKAFVESGDILSAQKIVLGELQTQFEGAAASEGRTTEATQQLRRNFEDFSQVAADRLLPALAAVVEWAANNFPRFQAALEGGFRGARAAGETAMRWFEANILPTIRAIIAVARRFWETFGDDIRAAFAFASRTVERSMTVIRETIELVLAILRGDWSEAWESMRAIVSTVVDGVIDTLRSLPRIVLGVAVNIGRSLMTGIMNGVRSLAGRLSSAVVSAIRGLAGAVASAARSLGETFVSNFVSALASLPGRIAGAVGFRGGPSRRGVDSPAERALAGGQGADARKFQDAVPNRGGTSPPGGSPEGLARFSASGERGARLARLNAEGSAREAGADADAIREAGDRAYINARLATIRGLRLRMEARHGKLIGEINRLLKRRRTAKRELRARINEAIRARREEIDDLIAEDADLVVEARELGEDLAALDRTAEGGEATPVAATSSGPDPDLAAQATQAAAAAEVARRRGDLSEAALRTFSGASEIGGGGMTFIQNNHMVYPGDPGVLRQLADVTIKGMALQGGVASPVLASGA